MSMSMKKNLCLYLDDVCEEVKLKDADDQVLYILLAGTSEAADSTRLNPGKPFGQLQKTNICTQATKSLPFQSSFQVYSAF